MRLQKRIHAGAVGAKVTGIQNHLDAGIFGGDYVVVRPVDDAVNGEIVVALIGEEATVKRFFREADHIRLQPENETMEPIRTTEASVIGRVVGGFRKI